MDNKEIKRIPIKVVTKEFVIDFEYETKKGRVSNDRRVLRHIDIELAKVEFKLWIKQSRTMFNAKILNVVEKEYSFQIIEL